MLARLACVGAAVAVVCRATPHTRSYCARVSSIFSLPRDVLVPCVNAPAFVADVFLFADEVELLAARVYELQDAVDYFVLIESNETHTGYPRRPMYGEAREWLERSLGVALVRKIHRHLCVYPPHLHVNAVILGDGPQRALHVRREAYARNECVDAALSGVLDNVAPSPPRDLGSGLVLLGDADEIPSHDSVLAITLCRPLGDAPPPPSPRDADDVHATVCFTQQRFHFNLYCGSVNMFAWRGTVAAAYATLRRRGGQWLRDHRDSSECGVTARLGHGGWHLSNFPFGDASRLVDKYRGFSETQVAAHIAPGDALAYWTSVVRTGLGDVRTNTHCEPRHDLAVLCYLPSYVTEGGRGSEAFIALLSAEQRRACGFPAARAPP